MKKILSLFIIALFTISISVAQNSDTSEVYRIVQEMPEFPGGEEALFRFIAENVVYTSEAKNANITGMVYISFIVESDGSISNVELADGTEDIGGGCVEECIRVVKLMPKWSPGIQRGHTVRVAYVLPLEFTLSGDDSEPEKTKKEIRKEKKKDKRAKN